MTSHAAFTRVCRLATTLALALGLPDALGAGLATRTDPNRNYRIRERFWVPAAADPVTIGLFRLDKNVSVDTALEDVLADPFEAADEPVFGQDESEGNVRDDSEPRPRHAQTHGDVEWLREGRVDGGVRFPAGSGARIVTPVYSELAASKSCRTAEAWFRPGPDGGEDRVLLAMLMRDGQHVTLRRQADGGVRLARGDATLGISTSPCMPANRWRHAALIVYWAETRYDAVRRLHLPVSPGLRVVVHGQTVIETGGAEMRWVWAMGEGSFWIGNAPDSKAPFTGVIDEIRVSRAERLYYPFDSELAEANRSREISTDWPYLRDARDVVIYDDFDAAAP
jgi:hypothetical protein